MRWTTNCEYVFEHGNIIEKVRKEHIILFFYHLIGTILHLLPSSFFELNVSAFICGVYFFLSHLLLILVAALIFLGLLERILRGSAFHTAGLDGFDTTAARCGLRISLVEGNRDIVNRLLDLGDSSQVGLIKGE